MKRGQVAENPGESAFGAIGVSKNEKYLHEEITIGDFSTWLEPLIGGTRGERSRGVGVRYFGGFECKENAAAEIAISRYPIT
jgi:hypothetical protein